MSTTRATKRPEGKPAPAKARQAPPTRARAAPYENSAAPINNKAKNKSNGRPVSRFKKGEVSNPHGRPKGAKNKLPLTVREMIAKFVENKLAGAEAMYERVAKKNPGKALQILAQLCDFIVPRLQRAEISGELNHNLVKELPAWEDVSPIEAVRVYQEMIHRTTPVKHLPSVNPYVAPPPEPKPAQDFLPASRPEPATEPAPERPRRRESALDVELTEGPADAPVTNVAVLDQRHSGEHQPIADARCAFCRQLWATEQEAAKDKALRHQRPWVIT